MKGIIFSTDMVKKIILNEKTQTRRVVSEKILKEYDEYDEYCNNVMPGFGDIPCMRTWEKEFYMNHARYTPGDVLWVRETWRFCKDANGYCYKAYQKRTADNCSKFASICDHSPKWRSPRYMPKAAARIFLRVNDARVERLQEISPEDCDAEGVGFKDGRAIESKANKESLRTRFMTLWDSLNAKRGYGWERNPWVFVIDFTIINGVVNGKAY